MASQTKLIASVSASTADEVMAGVEAGLEAGADLAEIRLDGVAALEMGKLAERLRVLGDGTCVLTCRSLAEGGKSEASAANRWQLACGLAGRWAAAVDVEYADLACGRPTATEVAELARDRVVIVSRHRFDGPVAEQERVLREMEAAVPESVGKIAWRCEDVSENLAALDCLKNQPGRRIVICMGEKGLLSRVLASKCQAWGSFASVGSGVATASGQVTVKEMVGRYGWRRQDSETRVYGVIGSPVAQSISPLIFNDQFASSGINAVYVPILVDNRDELYRFLDGCVSRSWLDIGGFSITAPHKESALSWAGTRVEPLAGRIGAANTLCLDGGGGSGSGGRNGGRFVAWNTDYAGALAALESGVGRLDFGDISVAVLGAGGVARAVVAGLCDRGARVTVYNRSEARGRALADAFGAELAGWEARRTLEADIVVNCTSVGMRPQAADSPLPTGALKPSMTVFDTVYNPVETVLLREARRVGCRVVDGVAMFVHQAAAQYRLWIRQEPDVDRMRQVVLAEVGGCGLASGVTQKS